jgi:hypothetical protein
VDDVEKPASRPHATVSVTARAIRRVRITG